MKNRQGKLNILVIVVMIVLNLAFAYFYNSYVRRVVSEVAYNDYISLQSQNALIIGKLKEFDDSSRWNEILEEYEEYIMIFDKDGNVVAKTENSRFSAFDAKVRTPFEYKGEAYILRSSIYLLRGYIGTKRNVTQFIIIELLFVAFALFILITIIYSVMLRPFRVVYKAIEEYDRSGKLMEIKLKGYAGRVYRRFASMAKNVESQQQNERRIIASISHDIKTPLTSIMGYSERLKKEKLTPERKERYINTVYDKAVDIRTIVDEFDEYLGYNMPYEMKKRKITVGEIKKCLISDYADDFMLSGISFEIRNHADEEAEIMGDIQRLKRVCSNILSNSVKHFKGDEKKILVEIFPADEMIAVKFSDNGKGVPEEKLELIFEPLYTSDEGRKVAGLGLSICREITEAHDGRIYAEKSDMGGLAVTVEIPRG
ncbi:MAG: HAMP domain-containing histidine kinase [Clostridia bacterium]|nr:HAMP domain-containing histidine kinase [Clostridia bacterium]